MDGGIGDGEGGGHGGVDAGDFFEHQDVGDRVEARATVGFGGEHAATAQSAELFDGVEREVVGALPVFDVRADFGAHEIANGVADEELVVGEGEVHGCAKVKFSMRERCYQISEIRYQEAGEQRPAISDQEAGKKLTQSSRRSQSSQRRERRE